MANTKTASIELCLKLEVEKVLHRLGLSMSEALSILQKTGENEPLPKIMPGDAAKPNMDVEEAKAEFLALIEEGEQSFATEGYYTSAQCRELLGL